ncbi:PREDICTED: ly6/PLAUR domain-containing protein 8 [Dipodomys ordii]|uniref:Ly6/PLAUR domain-containing protein 8 n=1 Tax=Dipodomys ordii TaxID=10020 RepID=A0A1S3F469_DIPOR|nr:PREDICTED: ly6/PLAUR domain-containing protein 8 [Dipodomys ordii]
MSAGTTSCALLAGLLAALAITAVEPLSCAQCDSTLVSCENVSATVCAADAQSCVAWLTSSLLGDTNMLKQNMSCSPSNCTGHGDTSVVFTVRVSGEEFFHFANQCCQGRSCNGTSAVPAAADQSSNTECPACFGYNTTSCTEKTQKCNKQERCVSLTADVTNGTQSRLLVKGCSDISSSTCGALSAGGNQTVGDVLLIQVNCTDAAASPTPKPSSSSQGGLRAWGGFWPPAGLLLALLLL